MSNELRPGFSYRWPIGHTLYDPHLHIVLSPPDWYPPSVVTIRVVTWKAFRDPSRFATIQVHEHPWLVHESQGCIGDAAHIETAQLQQMLYLGEALPEASANQALCSRLIKAICDSPHAKRDVKRRLLSLP